MTTPDAGNQGGASSHPGSDYYVNIFTGTIQAQSNPVLAAGLTVSGWEGPYTWAEAKAKASEGIAGRATPANPLTAVNSWLNQLGGQIGSGIDAALVAFLKDLWTVILGPLEIIAGAALAVLILVYVFKDDLASVAMLIK